MVEAKTFRSPVGCQRRTERSWSWGVSRARVDVQPRRIRVPVAAAFVISSPQPIAHAPFAGMAVDCGSSRLPDGNGIPGRRQARPIQWQLMPRATRKRDCRQGHPPRRMPAGGARRSVCRMSKSRSINHNRDTTFRIFRLDLQCPAGKSKVTAAPCHGIWMTH